MDLLQQAEKQHKLGEQLIPEYSHVSFMDELPQTGTFKVLAQPFNHTGDNSDKGCAIDSGSNERNRYKIGFFFSPEEHFDRALHLRHPALQFNVVPDVLRRNLFRLCTLGIHEIAQQRIAMLKEVMKLKLALASEERQLRDGMEAHVNTVTKDKALVLWRRLLMETQFPDMNVCSFMEQGVPLTGQEAESPLYFKKYAPAVMTVEQLDHQAVWKRRAMMGKSIAAEECEQEHDLVRESQEEVEAGFLEGPFTEEQINTKLGTDSWSLTRRFCLYQGEERKIRVIDNYKDSGVNAAFSSSSYLALQDTDFIVGFLRFVMVVLSGRDQVIVPLSDGKVLVGAWHPTMSAGPSWVGRCIDLSKAYKQVAIHKQSLRHGVLGFNTQKGGWQMYTTCSLPFGASASVYSFNKISRGIWHLLVHKFGLLTSVFYDDYPVFEVQPLAALTSKIVDAFLNVLGWRHAVQGKKAVDFCGLPVALGVQFNLENIRTGELVVQNKPGRIERIVEMIALVKEGDGKSKSLIASLAGLMNFAGGFVLGHHFKLGSHALNAWACNPNVAPSDVRTVCDYLLTVAKSVQPRRIHLHDSDLPWVIYTDGAYEDGKGTWGALVYDPLTGKRLVFAGEVPTVLTSYWAATVGEQLICEIELFAYICVRWQLRKELNNRYGIAFIDNESSRMTLIKRNSPSHAMFLMVSLLSLLDVVLPFSVWCERVPSASNPADLPSRGKSAELGKLLHATDCGDIQLPAYVLNFLRRDQFDVELAELVKFEAL